MALSASAELNAMDLTTAMVAEEIATELDLSREEALTLFLSSRVAEQLYNPELKLWCEGPSSVAADFLRELARH